MLSGKHHANKTNSYHTKIRLIFENIAKYVYVHHPKNVYHLKNKFKMNLNSNDEENIGKINKEYQDLLLDFIHQINFLKVLD
jgi:hypothetical protein